MLMNQVAIADGGVSDGGGGTTNPNPANPEWVVGAVSGYAKKILLMWLNAEEANFFRKSAQEQASSLERKLFVNNISIFDVVKKTPIEVRMSKPCYDKNGHPWDGSIYSVHTGAICISPFSMAPKLNEFNVHIETIALVMHEFSHLVGASEVEAEYIQKQVLYSILHADLVGGIAKVGVLGEGYGDMGNASMYLGMMIAKGSGAKMEEVNLLSSYLTQMRDGLELQSLSLIGLRQSRLNFWQANMYRLFIIEDGICIDPASASQESRDCQDTLNSWFRGQEMITAADLAKVNGDLNPPSEYKNVVIHYPHTLNDRMNELRELSNLLMSVRLELDALYKTETVMFREK